MACLHVFSHHSESTVKNFGRLEANYPPLAHPPAPPLLAPAPPPSPLSSLSARSQGDPDPGAVRGSERYWGGGVPRLSCCPPFGSGWRSGYREWGKNTHHNEITTCVGLPCRSACRLNGDGWVRCPTTVSSPRPLRPPVYQSGSACAGGRTARQLTVCPIIIISTRKTKNKSI